MRFLYSTIYRIDHIIKRFHEENSIMSGLFSQNNLLLCGVQLRVITSGILSSPASNVHVRLKKTGTEIKIVRETTNNNKNIYNLVKNLQRQQFSFTKTSIEIKVSLKILSHVSISISISYKHKTLHI